MSDSLGEEYDAVYYAHYTGPIPYSRERPEWLHLFAHLAELIVKHLAPTRVLDVGCAMGFLVEALRDRGIEAFGLDGSAYALSQVREDLRPYCWRADAAKLDTTQSYDVVTCIEVLEHLPEADALAALDGLTQLAPRVVFSSSPSDHDEPTHVNVQPIRYWVEAFAARGFRPLLGHDLSSFAPQALLFERGALPPPSVVELYVSWVERAVALHEQRDAQRAALARAHDALQASRAETDALRTELDAVYATDGWRVARALKQTKERLLPEGTTRQRVFVGARARLLGAQSEPLAHSLPFDPQEVAARTRPQTLIVRGCRGDSGRYRCTHLLEALEGAGECVDADAPALERRAAELAASFSTLVAQRAPLTPALERLIAAFREQGKPTLFETDDLLFDTTLDVGRVPGLGALVNPERIALLHETLQACDAALCSGDSLRLALERHGKPAFVLRNGASATLRAVSAQATRPAPRSTVVLGYASGTKTHDADLAQVTGPLARLMQRHPSVELHVVGHVALEPRLEALGDRIVRHAFVPWRQLPQLVAQFDVNLAPWDLAQPFSRAKSELKFLEAALVGVPTVASPIPAFAHAIDHGQTGWLASSAAEWDAALEEAVCDADARHQLGSRAKQRALRDYDLALRGRDMERIVQALRDHPRVQDRNACAARYLRGRGLEIGALHAPQALPADAQVTYVDRLPRAELIARYPELDPEAIVAPTLIDDGFSLATVPEASHDFVVANHVLEHTPATLQALAAWSRVLRPGGHLLLSVPIASLCFDRRRARTSLEHLLEDARLVDAGDHEALALRNLDHYREWVALSEPEVCAERGDPRPELDATELEAAAQAHAACGEEIHFHTFSEASFRELLAHTCDVLDPSLSVVTCAAAGIEVVAVLRKRS